VKSTFESLSLSNNDINVLQSAMFTFFIFFSPLKSINTVNDNDKLHMLITLGKLYIHLSNSSLLYLVLSTGVTCTGAGADAGAGVAALSLANFAFNSCLRSIGNGIAPLGNGNGAAATPLAGTTAGADDVAVVAATDDEDGTGAATARAAGGRSAGAGTDVGAPGWLAVGVASGDGVAVLDAAGAPVVIAI
jgi:hypothetical protein